MEAANAFLEKLPVETVKRVAKEFPEDNAIGSDGENAEMPDKVRSPRESWRDLAQKVQDDHDPKK